MAEASVSQLRRRIKQFIDAVEAGEVVRVTRNGRAVAEMRAPREAARRPPSWQRARPLDLAGVSLSKAVIDTRRRARD